MDIKKNHVFLPSSDESIIFDSSQDDGSDNPVFQQSSFTAIDVVDRPI